MIVALTRRALLPALVILIGACARPVQIGSDPGPVYALEVVNSIAQDLIVSYDAGGGIRTLGTVRGGGSERFIIAAPERLTITVHAQNAAGNRSAGPYTVQLSQGATPQVTLR
jgi:hypothetical protein